MGEGTPFGIMNKRKTIILGIGVFYFRNLSHVHAVEDVLRSEFPYPIKRQYKTLRITLIDGDQRQYYDLSIDSDEGKPLERNPALLENLLSKNDLLQWKFKGVPLFFTKANRVTEALFESAKKGITIYNYKI
jgi:hypothetical protein